LNNTGQLEDAIYWGAGQFPVSISSASIGSCAPLNINFNNPTTSFSQLPGGGSNGCSMARICDGAPVWVERCGSAITGNSSNGASSLDASFSASQTSICAGDCISFTDNSTGGPTSWNWIFQGASTTTSNSNAPTNICYPSPGTYAVTLIISNICGSDTGISAGYINVQSSSGSGVLISGNLTFCQGSNTTLSVPSAFSTYQWYLNGQPISGANSSFYTTQVPGSYYVTVGGGNCITTSNTVIVSTQNIVEANINSTADTLCPGDLATLQSTNNATNYQWLLNGTLIAGQSNASLTISTPGNYQLITTTSQGCSDTSVVYNIADAGAAAPSISSSIGSFSFCEGESITLSVNGNYSNYQWQLFNSNITGANSSSLIVTQAGTYSLQLTINGCNTASPPVQVIVNTLPLANIIASSNVFCNGESISLQSENIADTYQWLFNGSVLPLNQQQINVGEAGTYQLTLTNAQGCTAQSNAVNILESVIQPVSIIYDTTFGFCVGEALTLTASPIGYATYQWYLNSVPVSTQNTINASASGIYNLVVTNSDDCSTETSVNLLFNDCGSIYLPNAFSPNGDGINDMFRPLGNDIASFEMWIYNRFGEMIFYTNNKNIGWDGTYNLVNAPVGVYVYHFKAFDISGKELFHNGTNKGNVTLLR
jgi:gliding motility-associated-like protein